MDNKIQFRIYPSYHMEFLGNIIRANFFKQFDGKVIDHSEYNFQN